MYKHELPLLTTIRGLSALLVLFYHFFVFFFTEQEFSADLLHVAPLTLADPFYLSFIEKIPINIGHLGVSFFFLISGFFIQPSLEKYSTLSTFGSHKFFRLWPTYACCFGVSLLFVFVFCLLRDDPFPYSFEHVLAYFFWVRDIFGYSYIDGAIWSLEVQIKFYLFAAIVWSFARKHFLVVMVFLSLLFSAIIYGMSNLLMIEDPFYLHILRLLILHIKYFSFISIGMCLYDYYRKKDTPLKLGTFVLILLGCFLVFSRSKDLTYFIGFLIFLFIFIFQNIGAKERGFFSKGMKWVASISYPLYIGHVLPGYTIMYFLLEKGVNLYLALALAVGTSIGIGYMVHQKVEKRFL